MDDSADRTAATPAPEIVVGVDGSSGSMAALAHALTDASRRGARVRAVTVFQRPEYWAESYGLPEPPTIAELTLRGENGLRSTLAQVRRDLGPAEAAVPVDVTAVPGAPARVLVDQAQDADELVVGHRGRGGFAGALLGSVSLQCVLHAPCRVTVVRPPRERDAGRAAEAESAAT